MLNLGTSQVPQAVHIFGEKIGLARSNSQHCAWDKNSGPQFLVDTDAELNVLSATGLDTISVNLAQPLLQPTAGASTHLVHMQSHSTLAAAILNISYCRRRLFHFWLLISYSTIHSSLTSPTNVSLTPTLCPTGCYLCRYHFHGGHFHLQQPIQETLADLLDIT